MDPRPSRPFLAVGADITRVARRRTLDRFTSMFKGRSDIEYRAMFGDVTRPFKFAKTVKRLTHVSVSELVHLMMFVIEERAFGVRDISMVKDIFKSRVDKMVANPESREELAKILREMQALNASDAMPSGDELVRLVSDQFDISMSRLGRLV